MTLLKNHILNKRYRIVKLIGDGGMGQVYMVRECFSVRVYAIKVLYAHLVEKVEDKERFQREYNATACLSHPNIIRVYKSGQDRNYYFFVMDYLPGGTLKDKVKNNKILSVEETVCFLRPIADALDYAHTRDLVHRDVKPANILLDKNNKPVLTDFGIALVAEEPRLTKIGAAIGTSRYMSPEQAQCKIVDGRTDQYALGIIAFQLLTGRVPFDGETDLAILYKQVHETPPSACALVPRLPKEVGTALSRVLSKSANDRFTTCREFLNALAATVPHTATQDHDVSNDEVKHLSFMNNLFRWVRDQKKGIILTLAGIASSILLLWIGVIFVQKLLAMDMTSGQSKTQPAATAVAPAIGPILNALFLGCDTGIDVMHQMGEVTSAWILVQNSGEVTATNVHVTLSANDEEQQHPDKNNMIRNLPPGSQVSLKLTVDTKIATDTVVKLTVRSDEDVIVESQHQNCRQLSAQEKMDIQNAGWLGEVTPIQQK